MLILQWNYPCLWIWYTNVLYSIYYILFRRWIWKSKSTVTGIVIWIIFAMHCALKIEFGRAALIVIQNWRPISDRFFLCNYLLFLIRLLKRIVILRFWLTYLTYLYGNSFWNARYLLDGFTREIVIPIQNSWPIYDRLLNCNYLLKWIPILQLEKTYLYGLLFKTRFGSWAFYVWDWDTEPDRDSEFSSLSGAASGRGFLSESGASSGR